MSSLGYALCAILFCHLVTGLPAPTKLPQLDATNLPRPTGPGTCQTVEECMKLYARVVGDVVYAIDGNNNTCQEKTRKTTAYGSLDSLISTAKGMVTEVLTGNYQFEGCVRDHPVNDLTAIPPRNRDARGRMCQRQRRSVGVCDSDTSDTRVQSLQYNDTTSFSGQRFAVTNGIPDHCYQDGAIHQNPNPACENFAAMLVPEKLVVDPDVSKRTFTEVPMGPVGMSVSGAYLYNHKSDMTCDVAAIQEKPTFDPCDGHADNHCRYHYHKAPVCIKGYNTCKLMGYLLDGGAVYGECTIKTGSSQLTLKSCYHLIEGKVGCSADSDYEWRDGDDCHLDKANGYYFSEDTTTTEGDVFPAGTYAYFVTPAYPFLMPYHAGTFTQLCGIAASR